MGAYLPLFSLDVEHEFFSRGMSASLEFMPASGCERLMANTGLLKRVASNGLRIFYDEERGDALRAYAAEGEEALRFVFKVYSRDPLFVNYTEPSSYRENAVLYFNNRVARSASGGSPRLSLEDCVSPADFKALSDPVFEGVLDKRDVLLRPAFIVDISLGALELGAFLDGGRVESKAYQLAFRAKRTFWKYCLIGDLSKKNVFVTDVANGLEFERMGEEALSASTTAVVFQSKQPISLQQRFDYRLQLREKGPAGGRVLIKRLPVASANRIDREIINGEERVVSEIYVNC